MMTIAGVQGAVAAVTVTKSDFGKLSDGTAVEAYTLKNADLSVKITTFGARIVALDTKDRNGKMADVVLGYDSVAGYAGEPPNKTYFGSIVGRYGNRIAKGQFTLDGHTYRLSNHLLAQMPAGPFTGRFEASYTNCHLYKATVTFGPATEAQPDTTPTPQ